MKRYCRPRKSRRPAIDLYTVKRGALRQRLHAGQARAWQSKARFTFIIAGTQSGKTSFLPLWLFREIQTCGPGDYLAATANYDLFKLKLLPEMQRYFCGIHGGTYHKSDRVIELGLPAGLARIILRSANAPAGLESSTAKAAILDECGLDDFTGDSWEAVQRRLSLHQGRCLGGTTPYNVGWLKREVFDRWQAGDRDYNVVQFRSTENPYFPVEEYERARRTLPGWKFSMLYDGQFTRPAGLIYGDFTDQQVIEPFAIPASWACYLGVDPGGANNAVVWLFHDQHGGRWFVAGEELTGNKTTGELVAGIKASPLYRPGLRVFGGAPSEGQFRRDWKAAGQPVKQPPVSDVEAGIDRVVALIKSGRFFVFNSCRGLLDEIGRYSRPVDHDGQPVEGIKDKALFHRLDALRYVISGATAPAGRTFLISDRPFY